MSEPEIRKGKILGFQGSWGSGMATLVIRRSDTGEKDFINCENAPTVRALDSAFGGVITEGHFVNTEALKGEEIYYSVGDLGILAGFTPVNEAGMEIVEMYDRQKKKLKKVI